MPERPDVQITTADGRGLTIRDLGEPDVLSPLLAAAVEATRQGAGPLAAEMRILFARPWGFAPHDITTPAHLWYGAQDTLTPPSAGRYLQQQIPGAQLTIFPGEGRLHPLGRHRRRAHPVTGSSDAGGVRPGWQRAWP